MARITKRKKGGEEMSGEKMIPKDCEWCSKGLRFECYLIDEEGHTASVKDNIVQTCIAIFCPMCGRKLEEENAEKTS
jgi:hypothetical protein